MRAIYFVLDNTIGPNLLWDQLVETDWRPSIRLCDSQRLKRGTSQVVQVTGTIVLHVQTGESCICFMFKIFRNLAVSVLPGMLFINRFIEGIVPSEKEIVLFNSLPVLVLAVHETETAQREEDHDETFTK